MSMNIVLLGPPGAGKGTQAANIAGDLKLVHIATGDLFRQAIEQQAEVGKEAQFYMEKGLLVPDEITIRMVLERMSAPDCKHGVALDGFPRNLTQAETLDNALQKEGRKIDKVIYIKVSEPELLKRLGGRWICRDCQAPYHEITSRPKVEGKCDRCGGELYQRPDDKPEAVKQRLQVYFAQTAPLIKYYRDKHKLAEVDGEGKMSDISKRIITALAH